MFKYMQGASEFSITGTVKYYDVTPFLKQVKVPVLYTVGEFDAANPAIVQRFASMTPNSRVAGLPGAAHISMWDARDENLRVVRELLRSVDSLTVGTSL
jgi:pimeloyl-ACP methyl ester carboxylesterase